MVNRKMTDCKKRLVIIGAGASGLSALKQALEDGFEPVLFERSDDIGGIWKYEPSVGVDEHGLPIHSAMYEHLRTNLPKEVMEFEDFPYTGITESYLNHEQVLTYMKQYMEKFKLRRHIQFSTYVEEIKPLPDNRWSIRKRDLKTNCVNEIDVDGVQICVGNYSKCFTPQYPGTFLGSVIHSHDYRTTEPFTNKKVLIVGAGFSGLDIANALLPVAEQVIVSHKSPITVRLTVSNRILLKPEIKEFESTSVTFKDESKCDIDCVIYCTGYLYSFPFLSPECGITVIRNRVSSLYKYVVNLEHPTMAFIGLAKHIPIFPSAALQARFHNAILTGRLQVTREEMQTDIMRYHDRSVELNQSLDQDLEKNHEEYMKDLADTANIRKVGPVISRIYDFVIHEKFQIFNLIYRIKNDEEFEYFESEQ